jgi:hypothetical protein
LIFSTLNLARDFSQARRSSSSTRARVLFTPIHPPAHMMSNTEKQVINILISFDRAEVACQTG